MDKLTLRDNRRCFACGPENPVGLKLDFRLEDGRILASFTPDENHQGYAGITHGGILATVLDEAMARVLWDLGLPVLTASFEVRLRRPVTPGQTLSVEAWEESCRGKLHMCKGVLRDSLARIVSESEGVYVENGSISNVEGADL